MAILAASRRNTAAVVFLACGPLDLKHTLLSSIIISGMSRLIEQLKRTSLGGPQAIGFRTGQMGSTRPRLPLVACLSQEGCGDLAGYSDSIDAALIPVCGKKSDSVSFRGCSQTLPGISWGGWLKREGKGKVSLKGIDCDFFVFPLDTPPGVMQDTEAGKLLAVDSSLVGGGLAGTVDKLPVDAVLLADKGDKDFSLTCRYLMLVHYFAALLTKPFMVRVPVKINSYEIALLWEAGADGLLVMVESARSLGSVRKLRAELDKAELPSRRKQNAARPILPRVGGERAEEGEEEEEDE